MESALDQKLDLSALHLGTISLGKLLGALLTLAICLIAVRLVTALLRRVLDKTHIDARVRKYLVPVSYTHLDVYKRQGDEARQQHHVGR